MKELRNVITAAAAAADISCTYVRVDMRYLLTVAKHAIVVIAEAMANHHWLSPVISGILYGVASVTH